MKIITLDFESYYDERLYTLSKMTTEEYVRDARFEALCVSIVSDGKGVAIPQEHLKNFFTSQNWDEIAVVCHHAQFDCLILSHHYGIKPKFIFDTISMARVVHGPHQRVSLAALLKLYDLEGKKIDYKEQSGKRWHQMGDRTKQMMLDGAVHDSIQTEKIFRLMLPHVPKNELVLIDRTVRMFTEPHAEGDLDALRKVCNDEVNKKEQMLHELRITAKDLQSAPTFQKLLEAEGITVEYKYSKTVDKNTGEFKTTPAFAKTDEFMGNLLDDDNPRVRGLAEARLGVKSTLNETRSGRILRMTERGALCLYHHHAGTHTLRVTGGDKMNWVNLPRDGLIRKAIRAQRGKKFSIKDFSQFELRLCLWLAGQTDKLEMLANGGDIYSDLACKMYERPINKKDNEAERYVGKQVVLGSQYGQGHDKLYNELNFKHKVSVSREEAEKYVNVYREEYHMVKSMWKQATKLLPRIAAGEEFEWKVFKFKDGKCYAPNGSFMFFDHLEWRENKRQIGGGSWFMEKKPGRWEKMYGAKLVENLVQFLQRCIAADALMRIPAAYPLILWPYDEGVHVVDEDEAEEVHEYMLREMCVVPSYMEGLPIAAEGMISDRYDK